MCPTATAKNLLCVAMLLTLGCLKEEEDVTEQKISAQVLLKSASDVTMEPTMEVTSDNIDDFLPDQAAIASAQQAFKEAGFEVSNAVGNNFAIAAAVQVFEREFHTKLNVLADGSVEVVASESLPEDEVAKGRSRSAKYQLPLRLASKALQAHAQQVMFTPPPEFGPESFD